MFENFPTFHVHHDAVLRPDIEIFLLDRKWSALNFQSLSDVIRLNHLAALLTSMDLFQKKNENNKSKLSPTKTNLPHYDIFHPVMLDLIWYIRIGIDFSKYQYLQRNGYNPVYVLQYEAEAVQYQLQCNFLLDHYWKK